MTTLNLHANKITSLNEIDKLAKLTKLKNLTLHGNPVADLKGYHQYVLAKLPALRHLDFTGVTKGDKTSARIYREHVTRKTQD